MTQFPAVVTIPDLPLATTLSTAALFEAVQTTGGVGESVAATLQQIGSSILSAVIVPVTSGGTNTSTLTDFGVLFGNGTSTVGITAAGTAGWPLVGNGTSVAPGFAILGVPGGGTGTTTLTAFGVPYGNGTSTLGITAAGTAFWPLLGNGSALAPSFQQINLTQSITGVLSVPFGGTGTSTLTEFGVTYGNGSSTIGITSAGTALWALLGNGTSLAPSFQQINLTQSVTGVLTVPFGGIGTGTTTPFAVLAGGTTATSQIRSLATTGASGLVLMSQGSAALPIWVSAGAGTLTGPAAITTNSVPRWLTTTSLGTTNVVIDGSNNMTGVVNFGVAGTAAFSSTQAATSSTTGAITVAGGVGVAGDIIWGGTAFTIYTAIISASVGTFTTVGATSVFKRFGKMVQVFSNVTCTSPGSASGHLIVSLPSTPVRPTGGASGFNPAITSGVIGGMSGFDNNGAVSLVRASDGAFPIGTTQTVYWQFAYEES